MIRSNPVATPGCHALTQRLVLRPMVIGDLDRLVQIEAGSYSHPWSRGQFLDSLSAGHDFHVIGVRHEPIAGYSVVMPGVDEVHLLNLTVERSQRRQGHGSRLLASLIDSAVRQQRQAVWLEVRAGNQEAQALYRRHGFVVTGVRPKYYLAREGREDAVLMSLPLPPRSVQEVV